MLYVRWRTLKEPDVQERRKLTNDDVSAELSELRQRDLRIAINSWLEDPRTLECVKVFLFKLLADASSLDHAETFLSKLMNRILFAPIGKGVVTLLLSFAAIGMVIVWAWSRIKT
jgi:hypothetical protein